MVPPQEDPARVRAMAALRAFLEAQERLRLSMEKAAKQANDLDRVIGDEKSGLIAAVVDLIEELRAHRTEMALLRGAVAGIKLDVDVLSLLRGMAR
jgi:hypothetical protein